MKILVILDNTFLEEADKDRFSLINHQMVELACSLLAGPDLEVSAMLFGGSSLILRKAMAAGCGRGLWIKKTDADPLLFLMGWLEEHPMDLVITGFRTLDGHYGMLAPQLAARLDWPLVSFVQKARLDGGNIQAVRSIGSRTETVTAPWPCVLTVSPTQREQPLVDADGIIRSFEKPFAVLDGDEGESYFQKQPANPGQPEEIQREIPDAHRSCRIMSCVPHFAEDGTPDPDPVMTVGDAVDFTLQFFKNRNLLDGGTPCSL